MAHRDAQEYVDVHDMLAPSAHVMIVEPVNVLSLMSLYVSAGLFGVSDPNLGSGIGSLQSGPVD